VPARKALRALLGIGGVVATTAGLDSVIRGARSVPGESRANAALESELRYYGAFYAAYGVAVLSAAPRAGEDTTAVRALAAALFAAGMARAGGWIGAGKPHPLQRALLAIELAAPAAVVALQARVARAAASA
jgi:hypothetical protein